VTTESIVQVLAEAPVFGGMSKDFLSRLSRNAHEIRVEPGTLLFRGGEPAENFYMLLEGAVSIEIPAVAGPTLVVQNLAPVRVLCWSWLLPPFKWSFNARTVTQSKLLEFDGRAVLAQCEKDPAFGYEVIKRFSGLMAERLDAAHRKMMDQWSPPGFA